MSQSTIEERLARLEEQVASLLRRERVSRFEPGRDDWKSTLDMFRDDDPVMKEIIEETLKVREEDRKRTRP
jgi:hypothetical protein